MILFFLPNLLLIITGVSFGVFYKRSGREVFLWENVDDVRGMHSSII